MAQLAGRLGQRKATGQDIDPERIQDVFYGQRKMTPSPLFFILAVNDEVKTLRQEGGAVPTGNNDVSAAQVFRREFAPGNTIEVPGRRLPPALVGFRDGGPFSRRKVTHRTAPFQRLLDL